MDNKQIEAVKFCERLRKLNENADKKCVWDSIDRPIRPLVFELARIGMIPKFSCCGFYYDGEEEPKTHYAHGPYVHFWVENTEEATKNLDQLAWAFRLSKLVKVYHWQNGIFNLNIKNSVSDDLYFKKDGISESIHQYEGYALGIRDVGLFIQNNFKTVNDPVRIVDGNSYYKDVKEWQVNAKGVFEIGVDRYYELYGKIKNGKYNPENIFIPTVKAIKI